MPYIKKTVRAGNLIEITKTFASRYGNKGTKRGAHEQLTPDKVQKINEINAETKLRHSMAANFAPGDWHCVCTFKKKLRPTSYDDLKKVVGLFVAELRKYFRQKLKKELKYINAKGFVGCAPHVHLMLEGVDIRPICDIWKKYGTLRPTKINNMQHLIALPTYFLKHTKGDSRPGKYARRWASSLNLTKADVRCEVVSAGAWRKKVKPKKGYYLRKDSKGQTVKNYENALNGLPCQFFMLIRGEYNEDEWADGF